MENKSLNEKESLELITRMIQNSKKNLELGSGNIFLLWGYLSLVTAVVVVLLVWQTGDMRWNWVWFAIPALGYPMQVYLVKKEKKLVRTYTDKVIKAVWEIVSMAMAVAAIAFCLDVATVKFILPLMVAFAGIGVAITGEVINERWIRNVGSMSFIIAVFSVTNAFSIGQWYYHTVIFIVCIVLMFIIPGHRLNREACCVRKEAA